jgi:hypothetical protein
VKPPSLCNIEAVSTKGGLGLNTCQVRPSTRTFSFERKKLGGSTYTAVLSANGKKLKRASGAVDRDSTPRSLRSGLRDWSAELIGQDTLTLTPRSWTLTWARRSVEVGHLHFIHVGTE